MKRDEIVKLAVEKLLDIFQLFERKPDVPEPPARPEPEPRRLRQSEQKGIDMRAMGLAAERERKARRLPRSPEECRRWVDF